MKYPVLKIFYVRIRKLPIGSAVLLRSSVDKIGKKYCSLMALNNKITDSQRSTSYSASPQSPRQHPLPQIVFSVLASKDVNLQETAKVQMKKTGPKTLTYLTLFITAVKHFTRKGAECLCCTRSIIEELIYFDCVFQRIVNFVYLEEGKSVFRWQELSQFQACLTYSL